MRSAVLVLVVLAFAAYTNAIVCNIYDIADELPVAFCKIDFELGQNMDGPGILKRKTPLTFYKCDFNDINEAGLDELFNPATNPVISLGHPYSAYNQEFQNSNFFYPVVNEFGNQPAEQLRSPNHFHQIMHPDGSMGVPQIDNAMFRVGQMTRAHFSCYYAHDHTKEAFGGYFDAVSTASTNTSPSHFLDVTITNRVIYEGT